MRPEEILLEAEKSGLRKKVLDRVRNLRETTHSLDISTIYDLVWEEIQKEQRT